MLHQRRRLRVLHVRKGEGNHGAMWPESVSVLILLRVSAYRESGVRGVFVRKSCFFVSRFGMLRPRSARANAVEAQFLNFRVAV